MDETAEQIQHILDLLPEDRSSGHEPSILLWLEGRYLNGANDEWKSLTRYEQAQQYIEWLVEEISLLEQYEEELSENAEGYRLAQEGTPDV